MLVWIHGGKKIRDCESIGVKVLTTYEYGSNIGTLGMQR
jgi:hypothetical protein